jgi:hypothetical protein
LRQPAPLDPAGLEAATANKSVNELIAPIQEFIQLCNADQKPLRWTKSTDDVLAPIERFCRRTPMHPRGLEVMNWVIDEARHRRARDAQPDLSLLGKGPRHLEVGSSPAF